MREDRSLLEVALDDGRPLIALTGISLVLSGGFAIMQSVSGQLLPQDSHAIGLDSAALIRAGNRHLLGFMFHDRVAYGGTLVAIGVGYLWLTAFPMRVRFIGLDTHNLVRISPELIPVISHDRAGFGGGLCSIGSLLLFMARCAELNRSLAEIVAVMGCAGFGGAIGVHFVVGYVDFFHLLPAFLGLLIFLLADALLWAAWRRLLPTT